MNFLLKNLSHEKGREFLSAHGKSGCLSSDLQQGAKLASSNKANSLGS
jgi:hypothetical protein